MFVTLGDGRAAVERVPFPSRPIRTESIDVTALESTDSLRARIRAMADPDLILRIRLLGTADFDISPDLLAADASGLFHHLEIETDVTRRSAADVDAAAGEDTVLGAALRTLRTKASEAGSEEDRALVELAERRVWDAFRGGGGRA